MIRFNNFLLGALFCLSTTLFASITTLHSKDSSKAYPEGVLVYENNNYKVYSNSDAKKSDFDELYYVNLDGMYGMKPTLKSLGKIDQFKPGKFAIMNLGDIQAHLVSHLLHVKGLACGTIVKIDLDGINEAKIGRPIPEIAVSSQNEQVAKAILNVRADRIQEMIESLESMHTRYFRSETGKEVAAKLVAEYKSALNGRKDIDIFEYEHDRLDQPSLMVRIEGATKPEEIVILGSHIDSISGFFGGSTVRSPGADDNASGTSTNLEVFRAYLEAGLRPERTIEIHGYAAEELGLLGSKEIAKKYKSQNKKVISMLQNDMNLYSEDGKAKIFFVKENSQSDFNKDLGSLLELYTDVPYEFASLTAGTSDQESWHKQGYAAAFPFENPKAYNRKIHTKDDTTEHANHFNQSASFGKLSLAYLIHYAGIAN